MKGPKNFTLPSYNFIADSAQAIFDDCYDGHSKKPFGGLEFPGGEKYPDFMDFVYFSFVLGMTFQVSDVEISNSQLRRLAWIHGLISFAFNSL